MSTGLLDHASGIRGYQYVRTTYHDDRAIFTIRQAEVSFAEARRSFTQTFVRCARGVSCKVLSGNGHRPAEASFRRLGS